MLAYCELTRMERKIIMMNPWIFMVIKDFPMHDLYEIAWHGNVLYEKFDNKTVWKWMNFDYECAYIKSKTFRS